MKTKQMALGVALLSMVGCASNGQDSNVDHGDGIDTPDVLLQDTDGKSVRYGEREYGLDVDAKKNDQQIKPDPLVSGIGHGSSEHSAGNNRTESEHSATVIRQPSKTSAQAKQNISTQQTKEERLKRDSALEVEDPLLGEVDPK